MTDSNGIDDFLAKMEQDKAPRIMNAKMTIPSLEHSLELAQPLKANDQKSFLKRYREEWQNAISDLFDMTGREAFFKQLKRLTRYKAGSLIPSKVKKGGEVIEDRVFAETIMMQVLKDVKKEEDVKTREVEIFMPAFDVSVMNIEQVATKMSYKKAMGPDLIPDLIFSRMNKNIKRDQLINEFLTKPIRGSHSRSRLILLNKGKELIPDITDLRPITIMGTMQKLIETSIVQHLKEAMSRTSPFQFEFKPGTGTGTPF